MARAFARKVEESEDEEEEKSSVDPEAIPAAAEPEGASSWLASCSSQ